MNPAQLNPPLGRQKTGKLFPPGNLALFLLTLLPYIPSLKAGFIWDDDHYVTGNLTLRSLTGLWKIWTDPTATPQYYPLVHTTFWIEYHLWGLAPAGYHLVNILLHSLNAVLLWRVLWRLEIPGAWLTAALFAVHPVHAESVVWITERKNVLSGAFYLASLLAYARFSPFKGRDDPEAMRDWKAYSLALFLFLAALLSKTVTATLPVVILILIAWQRGKITRRDWGPLIPFFILGAVMGVSTAWLEKHHVGAAGHEWAISPMGRVIVAGRALWFYAGKLLWPHPLNFIYPRWKIDPTLPTQYILPAAFTLLLALLWMAKRRIGSAPLAALLIFAVTLSPALGFIDVFPFRYSYVADHFQYLASIPILALVSAILVSLFGNSRAYVGAAISAALLLTLGVLTWRQSRIYRDEVTLWSDTLDKNPGAIIAYTNLGAHHADKGDYVRASEIWRTGLDRSPDDIDLLANYGAALNQLGENMEATKVLDYASRLDPDNPWTQNNLGLALEASGDHEGARDAFLKAIRLRPSMVESYSNLATTLAAMGRQYEALRALEDGLKIDPNNQDLSENLRRLQNR